MSQSSKSPSPKSLKPMENPPSQKRDADSQEEETSRSAETRQIELETTLVGLNAEVTARRMLLGELDERIAKQIKNSEDLEAKNTAILAQTSALQEQITPLQGTIGQLRDQIDGLSAKRDILRDQIDDFRTEFEVLSAEKQRVVTVLESKREHLETDIIQIQDSIDIQREDLATRTRALDDREQTVKRREGEVARDDANNRRNAQLMNL